MDSTATIQVRVNGTSWQSVTSGSTSASLPMTNVAPTSNTIDIKVTAQDTTATKTYTITVTRAASPNANLSALTISSGALIPAFSPSVTSYTDSVPNTVSGVTVTPTAADATATIQVRASSGVWQSVTSGTASGLFALNVGSNTIDIKVTAQDSTSKTYTITVTRAGRSNADLSGLIISSGILAPAFSPLVISYTVSVPNSVSSVTVTPTAQDSTATIKVRVNNATTWQDVTSGTASGSLSLNVGQNPIDIKVTAQDTTTSNLYTVTVTRAPSPNANLSDLTISSGTLVPPFSPSVTSYTISVPNSVSNVTVTPTAEDSAATIQVRVNVGNWQSVTSGAVSGLLPLNVGTSTVEIKVTAQDSTTTKSYTITVKALAMIMLGASGDSFTMGDGAYGPNVSQVISYNYSMSKYEITNASFARFIADGGYSTRSYWTTNGWNAKQTRGWTEPLYWTDAGFNGATQPVVGISWYEAVAFCNWLSSTEGLTPAYDSAGRANLSANGYRLPTEVEWEYAAAKGAPGQPERVYPWGDAWDASRLVDYSDSLSAPADVGSLSPSGDTPQGLCDMSGNVEEWCSDGWEGSIVSTTDRYYFAGDAPSQPFIVRGGSWYHYGLDTVYYRCAYRNQNYVSIAENRTSAAGIRIVHH